jgi:hypothetical protein
MFKAKAARVAAFALVAAGAAFFISCQDEPTEPTGLILPETDDAAFYGYVYHGLTEEPIDQATVKWECTDHTPWIPLGQATTGLGGDSGYYEIGTEAWFTSHDAHDLKGTASKSGFDDAYAYINNYEYGISYRRDFLLYPSK